MFSYKSLQSSNSFLTHPFQNTVSHPINYWLQTVGIYVSFHGLSLKMSSLLCRLTLQAKIRKSSFDIHRVNWYGFSRSASGFSIRHLGPSCNIYTHKGILRINFISLITTQILLFIFESHIYLVYPYTIIDFLIRINDCSTGCLHTTSICLQFTFAHKISTKPDTHVFAQAIIRHSETEWEIKENVFL